MPRRGNSNNSMGGYGGSMGRKHNVMNNLGRSGVGKNNFGGGLGTQVNPWLSQSNTSSPYNNLGRMASDQQAQLALATTLLNNLIKPPAPMNKLSTTPPSLLSLNRSAPHPASSFGGSTGGFNRDRFSFGRQNLDKVQKGYRKGDFKNKRFGDRKNRKSNQANKQANAEKKAERKDVVKKEDGKVETMDLDQSTRDTTETATTPAPTSTESVIKGETKENDVAKKTKSASDEPKVSYSGIPSALLFCHICRKHMWDDSSFEKHLEGRPHKIMVEELDRSYKLKVDLLRHEMRVAEQQRENDIQRAHRKGKSNVKSQQRDFCTMCNLSFLGMLPAHRKNERHQRLKKFLHPKCNICTKEFYTRLEWDDHKLTPAHLKKLAEIRKETRPDLEDTEFDIIDFIEDIDDEYEMDNIELKVVGKRDALNDLQKEKCDVVNSSGENEMNETNEEKNEEDEEYKKLPKYSPGVPVGENFVVEKTGSLCRACHKFCSTSEDVKTHCQSVMHYNNIIKILKAQNKIVRKRRLNDTKTEDDGTEGADSKKCKTMADDDDKLAEINGAVKNEPASGEDVYDPENPGSESEKDPEAENSTKVDNSPNKLPETISNDPLKDKDPEIQEVVAEAPKEVKRGKSTAVRGPRARRGRRH